MLTSRSLRQAMISKHLDGKIEGRADYLKVIREANDEFRSRHPELITQYVRHPTRTKGERGKPYGLVLVFEIDDGNTVVSGSCCNPNFPRERWNKDIAFFYAANREAFAKVHQHGVFDSKLLPKSCFDVATRLVERYLAKQKV